MSGTWKAVGLACALLGGSTWAGQATGQDSAAPSTTAPHGQALRGRVVGRAGVPAAGLELLIRPLDLDLSSGAATHDPREHRRRTDVQGAFEVPGLDADRAYVVRARARGGCCGYAPEFAHLVTSTPIRPGDSSPDGGIVLAFSRPHVLVRLLDVDGQAWPEKLRVRSADEGLPSEWPEDATTFLLQGIDSGQGLSALDAPLEGTPIAPGTVVYEVNAGAGYLVGALGASFSGSPVPIDVEADSDRLEVELHAHELAPPGVLAVRVSHRGEELGRAEDDPDFTVVLQSSIGAVDLLADGPWRHEPPFVLRAPPGTYRILTRGFSTTEPYHRGLVRARALGQSEASIEIPTGTTREVGLELDEGGKLELTLEGRGSDAEFAAMTTAFLGGHSVHAVEVLLAGATGQVERVLRQWPGQYQPNLVGMWPLGETHVSERLPAGPATLIAHTKGGREVRVTVELRAGETVKATLKL